MGKQVLVALTGAGISAESGLQTFRDSNGLWEGHRVEDVATPYAWAKDPEMVLGFYNMRRSNVKVAQPNAAHKLLADLQDIYDVHIVTQNIDDLHERAGSKNVMHLHGEIFKMRSEHDEGLIYPIYDDIKMGDTADDGAQLRPHIVWFGEPVHMIAEAIPVMQMADIFVLVGSSLVVYPAAGLIDYVGHHVKKYVLDRKIPSVSMYNNIIPIEKPATEGAEELKQLLLG